MGSILNYPLILRKLYHIKIMKISVLAFFYFLIITGSLDGFSQSLMYKGKITPLNNTVANHSFFIDVKIFHKSSSGNIIFNEKQKITTDSAGIYLINIGTGNRILGNVDSIIWSDDAYYLKIESDTAKAKQIYFSHSVQLRAPTELNKENLEGMASEDSLKGWGKFVIVNERKKSPKKITIDLSTSYVNIAYPADTYPIYRHYEWVDDDKNGLGNSLMLTYSDKTTHQFIENTKMIGEVKLYSKPFQELWISNLNNNSIELSLTKPEKIKNLSETYAIKGPWKIIYFIEW